MFRVGDKVAVVSRHRSFPEMAKVSRVLKRFVELDNGSRWRLDGQPYPAQDWPSRRITRWTDEHTRDRQIAEAVRQARNLVERLLDRDVAAAWALVYELRNILREVNDEKADPSHQDRPVDTDD